MSTKQIRRRFSGEFKVVVEALKERHSLAELSQKYEVSQVMIFGGSPSFWKQVRSCLPKLRMKTSRL